MKNILVSIALLASFFIYSPVSTASSSAIPDYVTNAEDLITNAYGNSLKFGEKQEDGNWFVGAAPYNYSENIDIYLVLPVGGDMGFSILSVNGTASTQINRLDREYSKYFAVAPYALIKNIDISKLVDYFKHQ